jgi:hypothetical protein
MRVKRMVGTMMVVEVGMSFRLGQGGLGRGLVMVAVLYRLSVRLGL